MPEVSKITEEIESLQRRISLLPEEHPLRREAEARVKVLERELEEERQRVLRDQLKRLAGEVEHLRHEFGLDLEEIRSHIATLTERVEERIRPEEVRELGRMLGEIRAFHEGLLLPWRREISKELEEGRLWTDRIARGECELVSRIEGDYAIYESYLHLPTGESWVKTISKPYARQY